MRKPILRLAKRLPKMPFAEEIVLLRTMEGSRNEFGEYVPGGEERVPFQGASAPVTGEARLALPEGLRNKDVRTFWGAKEIRLSDTIEYAGSTFEVFDAQNWGGRIFEAMGVVEDGN